MWRRMMLGWRLGERKFGGGSVMAKRRRRQQRQRRSERERGERIRARDAAEASAYVVAQGCHGRECMA